MRNWADGRIKMFLTQRLLQFRREHADLFQRGEYLPVHPTGTFAECCTSFVRHLPDKWIVVVTPRFSSRIGFPPVGERWKDTTIELPETLSLEGAHDLFTCRPVAFGARQVKLADSLSVLPFAAITNL
jgi:(1->4)-alpha-D-glucan 1-alpha-D-glucosylmutase